MARTRGETGNARPRVFLSVDTAPANPRASKPRSRKTAATKTGTKTKKSATGAGVKKRAPNTHHKRKPTLGDKVKGEIEKVVGKIEGRPGKVGAGTKKKKGTDGKGSRTAKA